MIDTGEALTADQMQEYREAAERRARNEESVRLVWAARSSVAILILGVLAWLLWSVQQTR